MKHHVESSLGVAGRKVCEGSCFETELIGYGSAKTPCILGVRTKKKRLIIGCLYLQ